MTRSMAQLPADATDTGYEIQQACSGHVSRLTRSPPDKTPRRALSLTKKHLICVMESVISFGPVVVSLQLKSAVKSRNWDLFYKM